MKHKLLFFLLFTFLLSSASFAQISKKNRINGNVSAPITTGKTKALIPAPLATAGSSCKDINAATTQVFITASGNSGDIIEWFDSQTSTTVLRTGSIFSPLLSKTTTFYVQSRSGNDLSVRVPVVASVYNSPPDVVLTVSPTDSPVCKGVPLTFAATGGGDLFEFSVGGNVVQAMSASRVYRTTTLAPGQTVKVRTRYGVSFDGSVSEAAWGTGEFEDNALAANPSPSAVDGYLTSVKVSSSEDKLLFGLTGKLGTNRSALLFLDTKPGGFNLGNYGDEGNFTPSVKGFNYFNNNPSTFDSYFLPDYCLAISSNDGGVSYFADIIELRSGVSTKVNLGTASNGTSSANFGANSGNVGANDMLLGFEIAVLKSQIGYVTGDIKFFGFTMKDDSETTYSVTNSFISPERTSTLDFGSGAINFNLRDPKAVVVSSDALIPCYKEASLAVSILENPTTATVGTNQINCSFTSTQLGGNLPTVGSGSWSLKSGPGTVNFSSLNDGSSTATVDTQGVYVFTWTISNGSCEPSKADITIRFDTPPTAPIAENITQCAQNPVQIVRATATVVSGTSVKWYTSLTGGTEVVNPTLNNIGIRTYFAEAVNTISGCVSASRTAVVLTIRALPAAPVSGGNSTECEQSPLQTLTATATVISGQTIKWYDAAVGGILVANPSLNTVGTKTFYAAAVDDELGCMSANRTAVVLTIRGRPASPVGLANQTVCTDGTTTQRLTATGSSVIWYASASGGSAIANPTQVGVGSTTYYAESSDGVCTSFLRSPVTLTIVGVVPNPVASDQSVCSNGSSSQTLVATASGNTITWYNALTGGSAVSNPVQSGVGTSTYYAESSIGDCKSVGRTRVVLTISSVPVAPTISSITQPSCLVSTGSIVVNQQPNVEYSIGSGYQISNVFSNVSPGAYTVSVRFLNNTSCPVNASIVQRINAIPAQIQFDVVGACVSDEYVLTATALANSYDETLVEYIWKDQNGVQVGSNSSTLNVSTVIASSASSVAFPFTYTLTVKSVVAGCETTKPVVINGIYCNIQKGISPDGNGSNEFLDLSLMDVRNLEIFNRYGLKVYSMPNYKNQWKGQTNKGEELPSATYYYVIEFNNGQTKTGWIYLIR